MAEAKITSQPLGISSGLMKIAGSLDSGNFEALEDELNRLLESGIKGVAVDFTEVEHVSSAALGAFVNLAAVLRDRQGTFMLAGPRPELAGLIDMLGIRDALGVVDKLDTAKRALANLR